ncbi:unnamed protein product [Bubo scandiacus]
MKRKIRLYHLLDSHHRPAAKLSIQKHDSKPKPEVPFGSLQPLLSLGPGQSSTVRVQSTTQQPQAAGGVLVSHRWAAGQAPSSALVFGQTSCG